MRGRWRPVMHCFQILICFRLVSNLNLLNKQKVAILIIKITCSHVGHLQHLLLSPYSISHISFSLLYKIKAVVYELRHGNVQVCCFMMWNIFCVWFMLCFIVCILIYHDLRNVLHQKKIFCNVATSLVFLYTMRRCLCNCV